MPTKAGIPQICDPLTSTEAVRSTHDPPSHQSSRSPCCTGNCRQTTTAAVGNAVVLISRTGPLKVSPAGGGPGAKVPTAVTRPGCCSATWLAVTGTGLLFKSVATTATPGLSTWPPMGGATWKVAMPWPMLPEASRKATSTQFGPIANSVVGTIASITIAGSVQSTRCAISRTGFWSATSVAVPAARKNCNTAESGACGTLLRAPVACVAATRIGAGTVTAGAVVSRTVTLKLPVAVFPAASVDVQVTVV